MIFNNWLNNFCENVSGWIERKGIMGKFVVVIVGRLNVGKFIIFNWIVGERILIVEDIFGVMWDWIYSLVEWLNYDFNLIDMGGIDIGDELFLIQICQQVEIVMDEVDVIIFMVNGCEGVMFVDEEVVKILYWMKKLVVLVVNKLDNIEMRVNIYDFYVFGFGELYFILGIYGLGLGDLFDVCVEYFKNILEIKYNDDVV